MTAIARSIARYTAYFLGTLISLIIIVGLILALVRIPLELGNYKNIIETSASNALGRKVRIEGDITVTTSLWPYFEIQGLRIIDDDDFGDGDLANMELARITVGLVPLIKKQIHIREFRIENLELNLIRAANGAVNWQFDQSAAAELPPPSETEVVNTQLRLANDGLAADEIVLGDISVNFEDRSNGDTKRFELTNVSGSAPFGEPMSLTMSGILRTEPFSLDVEANSLSEFLSLSRSRLEVDAEIADTKFHFAGQTDSLGGSRNIEFDVYVEGQKLGDLGNLFRLDLPPLENYNLGAAVRLSPGLLEISNVAASVQNSELKGEIVIDKTGAKPSAEVQLISESIQLTDFDLGDWSPDDPIEASDSASLSTEETNVDQATATQRAKLLSPDALQRANISVKIEIDDLLSGDDTLGNGNLDLSLKDGRLALEQLRLETPKASLAMSASVKPDIVASDASLKLVIDNFDLGALARLSNPDSDVSGPLDMDLDVTMTAKSIRDLLSGANGYIDVAGSPENVESDLVDLWAVNLLSSVVSSAVESDNEEVDTSTSEINCVISRWSITDGLMTAQQFAIDTSRIRICGTGNINFKEKSFDLEVFPTAKKPEFFSLAAPLTVNGRFEDFDVGAKGGVVAVGTTAVKFAISPLTTPIKRMVKDNLPEDGADICELPIGPHNGELDKLPGC